MWLLAASAIMTIAMPPHVWTNARSAFVAIKSHSSRRYPGLPCTAPEFACLFNLIHESADERDDAAARRTNNSDVVAEVASIALDTVRTAKNLDEDFSHCHMYNV